MTSKRWIAPALFAVALAVVFAWLGSKEENEGEAPREPTQATGEATPPAIATNTTDPPREPTLASRPADDAGTVRGEKPESEEAFLRELVRLDAIDKTAALAYARQGDDWFSSTGRAAEARKARAITLLVDLGRMEEARAETRAFIAAYPESEYRRLVQGVTGVHPRPGRPGR